MTSDLHLHLCPTCLSLMHVPCLLASPSLHAPLSITLLYTPCSFPLLSTPNSLTLILIPSLFPSPVPYLFLPLSSPLPFFPATHHPSHSLLSSILLPAAVPYFYTSLFLLSLLDCYVYICPVLLQPTFFVLLSPFPR